MGCFAVADAEVVETEDAAAVTASAGDSAEVKEFAPIESQEVLDEIVQKRLARERAKFSDYDELKAAAEGVAAEREAHASALAEVEARVRAAEERAVSLEAEASAAGRAVLVERVAASKGVPARYLSGDSEDELNASADEFLADVQALPRPGYVPSAGTGAPDASADSTRAARERAASVKI